MDFRDDSISLLSSSRLSLTASSQPAASQQPASQTASQPPSQPARSQPASQPVPCQGDPAQALKMSSFSVFEFLKILCFSKEGQVRHYRCLGTSPGTTDVLFFIFVWMCCFFVLVRPSARVTGVLCRCCSMFFCIFLSVYGDLVETFQIDIGVCFVFAFSIFSRGRLNPGNTDVLCLCCSVVLGIWITGQVLSIIIYIHIYIYVSIYIYV